MSYGNKKIVKSVSIRQENTLTPSELEITPGGSASTKTTIVSSQTANRTITTPDATDTLVGKATTDTLTNKTVVVANNTITTAPSGNLSATELNAALAELQTDIDTRATDSALTAHINDTSTHGVSGDIVGTTDAQAISNKTSIAVDNLLLDGNTLSSTDTNGNVTLNPNGSGVVDVSTSRIVNVTDPSSAQDAATKQYVDDATAGGGGPEFSDNLFRVIDNSDATKKVALEVSGVTTGTTRTLTVPNASTTIVGTDVTQTLSNKSFSDALTGAQISTPSNPSAGNDKLYFKSDDKLYRLTSAGTESEVGSNPLSPYELQNIGLSSSSAANALTITLTTAAAGTPSASDPINIGFRSLAVDIGTVTRRTVTSSLTITVSSGSTLGHLSGVDQYIYVYAADDAGTVRLAVSSLLFDDSYSQTIIAEGGAGAADSADVLYWGTTSGGSKPIRLLGRITINNTVAGTWTAGALETVVGQNQPSIQKYKNTIIVTNAGYTATNTHQGLTSPEIFLFSTGGSTRTLSLPPVINCYGRIFTVTKTDSGTGIVTLDPNSSETINGLTTTNLSIQYESITIQSNGTSWSIINRYIPSIWTTFTPSTNITTNATNTGKKRRVGDSLELQYEIVFSGANTEGIPTFTIPDSLTINTSKLTSTDAGLCLGKGNYYDNSAASGANRGLLTGTVSYVSTTEVQLFLFDEASASTHYLTQIQTNNNLPVTVGANDRISIKLSVPITGWDG